MKYWEKFQQHTNCPGEFEAYFLWVFGEEVREFMQYASEEESEEIVFKRLLSYWDAAPYCTEPTYQVVSLFSPTRACIILACREFQECTI